jgi:hypothetical protein
MGTDEHREPLLPEMNMNRAEVNRLEVEQLAVRANGPNPSIAHLEQRATSKILGSVIG